VTSPGGGDINLATLWIPIVPETSHIGEAARRAGEQMKRELMYGFGSFEEFGGAMGSGIMQGLQRSNLPGMFDPILNGISGKQALMIGAVALAVESGINLVTRGVETMLDTVVKAGQAVAKEVYDIGITFDELNKSIILYTDAQSDQLGNLQQVARDVYGQLDVGAEKLGQNLAILSKQFRLTTPELKELSYEVTELEGRFGGLDIRSLLAQMHQFGVEGHDISRALQLVVGDARHMGVNVNELQQALVKTGPVFQEMGVGLDAASEALAKMVQLGDDPLRLMQGLSHAAGQMGKGGNTKDLHDFALAQIEVLENYEKAGDKYHEDLLSNTLFGYRFSPIVLQNVEALKMALQGIRDWDIGPAIPKVIEDSRTWPEKLTLFRHQLELALQPLGHTMIEGLTNGLENLSAWFDKNHEGILRKIEEWGDKFIAALPTIQRFAADGIEFLGQFADFTKVVFENVLDWVGALTEGFGELFGNDKMQRFGLDLRQMAEGMSHLDFTKLGDTIGEAIRHANLHEDDLAKDLHEGIDKALKKEEDLHVPAKIDPQKKDGTPVDPADPHSTLGLPKDLHVKITPDLPHIEMPWWAKLLFGGIDDAFEDAPDKAQWDKQHPNDWQLPPDKGPPGYYLPPFPTAPWDTRPNMTPPRSSYPWAGPGGPGPTPPGMHPGGPGLPGPILPNIPGMTPGHGGAFRPSGAGGVMPAGMNLGGGSKEDIASAIFSSVTGAGYSSETGAYAVAAAMLESGLDPNNPNNPTHFGLFQETGDKPHAGAMQQIQWFVSALGAAGGPGVVDASPASMIADRVERGGYPGSNYNQFIDKAKGLISSGGGGGYGGGGMFTPGVYTGGGGGYGGGDMGGDFGGLQQLIFSNPATGQKTG
jgi:hypothetical protein